jgi:NAD(P)H dehydrogenase (quinone)
MTSLVAVLAHPRPDSFCAALFGEVVRAAENAGADVTRHDLYRDGFDPVLTASESAAVAGAERRHVASGVDPLVETYQRQLVAADRLVVVHPNWWGKPPAILSGWLDRVLAPEVAYKLDGNAAGAPEARLELSALVVTTGDTDHAREAREFGDPLAAIWERCVLPYVGARHAARVHISPVSAMTADQRGAALRDVGATTTQLLHEPGRLVSRAV